MLRRGFTELAPAILLVIEAIFLDYGYATLAQAPLPPVLFPKSNARITPGGISSGLVYLLQTLPTARRQRSGDDRKTVFRGIARSI